MGQKRSGRTRGERPVPPALSVRKGKMESGPEERAKRPSPLAGLHPLLRKGERQPGMARILGAVAANRERLLREDPWVPFPQDACGFLFGERRASLPLGALVILWERWPAATGRCLLCGEAVYAVGFGGLLTRGGIRAVCAGCGEVHFRPLGGLGAVASAVRPFLQGTDFALSGGVFGGAVPGPARPLLALMRRLHIPLPPRRRDRPDGKRSSGFRGLPPGEER